MRYIDMLTKKLYLRVRASWENVFIAKGAQEDDIIPVVGYLQGALKTNKKDNEYIYKLT